MFKKLTVRTKTALAEFQRLETAGGTVLVLAAVVAVVVANTPLVKDGYEWVLAQHLTITLGGLGVDKPLLLWINDALMALFFLLVGLEIKREVVEGQLSSPDQFALPVLAAVGGLVLPALVFWHFNADQGAQRHAWAIPTATDIAFALAVLGLLGSRVPLALKLFLTTVAIVDDLAAIMIIAAFFTRDLSFASLSLAVSGIAILTVLNRKKVTSLGPYMVVGLFVWLCILKSGVHATLAGVIVALFIPLRAEDETSPARHLEHMLHPWVAWGILPLFAFANSGVDFSQTSFKGLAEPLSLGIILGLIAGKPIGVVLMAALGRMTGLIRLPDGITWPQIIGVGALCGIGFTMSLFIGSLALELGHVTTLAGIKLAVLLGSLVSAGVGIAILYFSLPKTSQDEAESGGRSGMDESG